MSGKGNEKRESSKLPKTAVKNVQSKSMFKDPRGGKK